MQLEKRVKAVEFTPVSFVNVEMMKEMLLAGAIEPKEFDRVLETTCGLNIKTREPVELNARLEAAEAQTVSAKATAEVAKITAANPPAKKAKKSS